MLVEGRETETGYERQNLEMGHLSPHRPFLSGQVAYSLASEVIGLLYGLLTIPGAAEVWGTAIKEVCVFHSAKQQMFVLPILVQLGLSPQAITVAVGLLF